MNIRKCVFCFEGINTRVWELYKLFPKSMLVQMEYYSDQAKEILKIDSYQRLMSGKTEDELENAYTELVCTYLSNYVIFKKYIECGMEPELLVGFSLGLNTAMVCSGCISFEEGLEILLVNRHCMEYLSQTGDYGMAFVVGLPCSIIEEILSKQKDSDRVKIASETSEYSLLLTGENQELNNLEKIVTEEGALRYNRIRSYIPFHYGLHNTYVDNEMDKIGHLSVYKGKYPVYSVYSLKLVEGVEEVREELKRNIYSKMHWREAISELEQAGYRDFFDVSITGSNKKISTLQNEDSEFFTFKKLKKQFS